MKTVKLVLPEEVDRIPGQGAGPPLTPALSSQFELPQQVGIALERRSGPSSLHGSRSETKGGERSFTRTHQAKGIFLGLRIQACGGVCFFSLSGPISAWLPVQLWY